MGWRIKTGGERLIPEVVSALRIAIGAGTSSLVFRRQRFANGAEPSLNSIWPGQQMTCGICGGLLHRTLNDQLKCEKAFRVAAYPCWSHGMVRAETVRAKVIRRILACIKAIPEA